jgi:LysM repeat protein
MTKPISPFISSISLISSLIIYPAIAHAGLFSFFSDNLITSARAAVATSSSPIGENLQNMSILKPAINLDPNPNKIDDTYFAISGDSISPEIGPAGTLADIDKQMNSQISTYVVHDGDTLSGVAKIFNVSINTIVWANNLDRSVLLTKGQTLIILPISGIQYTIKKGDTLKNIVANYKADLNEVLQYNNISLVSTLMPGDTIVIPDAELGSSGVSGSVSGNSAKTKWNGKGIPPRSIWGRTNPVHDANGPYYPGYYIRPIDGGYESQGLHGYNAVDLADVTGTPIHAAAEGTVIISMMGGWNGGYGNYVVISHPNGTQTLYGHALRNLVSVGQHVEQGQTIALLGKTGEATGPHVHFEIRGARNPF